MDNYILKKTSKHIKRVIGISDIHIKNNDRDIEYMNVFDNLHNKLTELNIDNTDVITILGDTLDDGTYISAKGISMVVYLFRMLTGFGCDVIVIFGNHDLKHDSDILTPLLKDLKTDSDIYILTDNKVYLYEDIAFAHTKFDAKQITQCNRSSAYTTIALYHGMLCGSKLDNSHLMRTNFSLKDFSKFEYCMFGDVHKMQFYRKNRTAFHIGSLIQQSILEDPMMHGIMVVDIETRTVDFHRIKNKYRKLNLIVDKNGKVSNYDINELLKDVSYTDMQVTFGSSNRKGEKILKQKLEKSGVTITKYITNFNCETIQISTKAKVNGKNCSLSAVDNRTDFMLFFMNYIEKEHKTKDMERIQKNMTIILNELQIDDRLKPKRNIDFLEIKINNIMIFGENVSVNIQEMNGLLGICETNSMGKSSLCEMISIILFGISPRCKTSNSFIRQTKMSGNCSIKLISNGNLYEIRRTIKKRKKNEVETIKCKSDQYVEYIKYLNTDATEYEAYTNNGIGDDDQSDTEREQIIDEEKETDNDKPKIKFVAKKKKEIEQLIENNIILFDEIYEYVVVSQGRHNSFVKNDDKIEMLFKVSNMSYLNDISVEVNKIIRSKTYLLNTNISEIAEEFRGRTKKKIIDVEYLEKINKEAEKKKKEVDHDINTIDEKYKIVQKDMTDCEQSIAVSEDRIKKYEKFKQYEKFDISELRQEINDLEIAIEKYDTESLINQIKHNDDIINSHKIKLDEYKNIVTENTKFKKEQSECIANMNQQIEHMRNMLKPIEGKVVNQSQYTKIKQQNTTDKEILTEINKEIEIIEQKIKMNKPTSIFSNYKIYFEKSSMIDMLEKQIIMYDDMFKKVQVLSELQNTQTEKFLNTEKKVIRTSINKIKKELIEISSYKDDYDAYTSGKDFTVTMTELTLRHKELTTKIKTDEILINNFNNECDNKKIRNELDIVKKHLENKRCETFSRYDEYIEIKREYDTIERENNILKINLEKMKNRMMNDRTVLLSKKGTLDKVKDYEEQYEEFCIEMSNLENLRADKNIISKRYEALKKESLEINTQAQKFNEKYIVAMNILGTSRELLEDIDSMTIIQKSMSTDGIADKIMKDDIVCQLNKIVSDICEYIGHEKVYIHVNSLPKSNKNKKYEIVISTQSCLDISNSGGFQSNMIELIFKLSFLRINSYFKCSFIIIDEIFDACSVENRKMAIKLIEFFKLQYKKMIVVSHNEAIVGTFDKRLRIKGSVDGDGHTIETM